MQETERYLKVEQVAVIIGSSVKTINNWYAFKRLEPDNEKVQLLPDFIQHGARQTRYWRESDIPKLMEFKASIPVGRNGFLGKVTQKYYRKRKKEEVQDGKKTG